jgi:hypothetical protein
MQGVDVRLAFLNFTEWKFFTDKDIIRNSPVLTLHRNCHQQVGSVKVAISVSNKLPSGLLSLCLQIGGRQSAILENIVGIAIMIDKS